MMTQTLDALRAGLKATSMQHRALSRRLREQERRRATRRKRGLQIACLALAHEPDGITCYANFLLRRYPHTFTEPTEDLVNIITNCFLVAPLTEISQWLGWQCVNVPDCDVIAAKTLLEEVRLLDWVANQNANKGLAPPQRFVWERLQELKRMAGTEPLQQSAHSTSAAKKWMARYRRRWKLQVGRQPVEETVPLETLRAKVCSGTE